MRYRHFAITAGLLAMVFFLADSATLGQRRGGGGGGFKAGGGGGFNAGAVVGPYGGGGAAAKSYSTGAVIGPGGKSGVVNTGAKSGSYVAPGGSTINYGGAGGKVTGSQGGAAGKVIGGVQVTTPGGKTATKVGTAGGAVGPGGKAGAISRSGAAIGPGGANAGKSGAVIGPQGGFAAYRGVSTGHTTRYVAAGTLHGNAVVVRNGFVHYNCFRPNWYVAHPNAWRAAAWTAATFWTGATWASLSNSCGYAAEPAYYEYGSSIVYQDNQVYYGAEPVATAEEYAQQASVIAAVGQEAKVSDKEEWIALGVFGMVQGEEKDANNLFQLAINQAGVIRGNFYNALTDTSTPVFGSVKKATQRAAWVVGDRKEPVYETGIANLTEPETQMLVHFGNDRTQQWTLVRMDPPPETP